jgi:hypothetical protein
MKLCKMPQQILEHSNIGMELFIVFSLSMVEVEVADFTAHLENHLEGKFRVVNMYGAGCENLALPASLVPQCSMTCLSRVGVITNYFRSNHEHGNIM